MARWTFEIMRNTNIFTRLTVTLSRPLAARLATVRDAHGVSVSALVEHAVARYFDQHPSEVIDEHLRASGAALRRTRW